MKWNLTAVAIAATVLLTGIQNSRGQGDSAGFPDFQSGTASSAKVSDDGARMSVGDGNTAPPNGYFRPGSSPLMPAHFQGAEEPQKPAVSKDGYGAAGCTTPGCNNPGCDSTGCTAAGCTSGIENWCDTCGAGCCGWGGAWGSVEYLHVWPRGRNIPALVTSQPNNGVLPNAAVLFGNERIGETMQSAGRVTAGLWTDGSDCNGFGMRLLALEGDKTQFSATSTGAVTLARPFFDTNLNQQNALIVALPGSFSGNINVRTSSDTYAGEAFMRLNIDRGIDYRVDVIGGYHFTRIDDGLVITSSSTSIGGNVPVGTVRNFTDSFDTKNEFHGGEFGFLGEYGEGPWTVSMLTKLSVGRQYEQVRIQGSSSVVFGGQTNFNGGLLALGNNLGTFQRTETVFIPEVTLNLNRQLTDRLSMSIGYSFIYWSSLLLAGDQIDTNVNGTQVLGGPAAANPAFVFVDRDYWLHAINFGMNYRF